MSIGKGNGRRLSLIVGKSERPFCVKGGEIIGNVPTIEELAVYIKEYILNDEYGAEWASDIVKGASRQAIFNMHQQVVGQLIYKGLWDASGGVYPSDPELGWYYVISVAGEIATIWYNIGDWIIWNGTSWDKLAGKADVEPIGIQKIYYGEGIKGNLSNRDYEISVANGDDFDMKGWFVANGFAGTPYCIGKFQRLASGSGAIGGSDDSVVVQHNHPASQVAHSHKVGLSTNLITFDGIEVKTIRNISLVNSGYMSDEQPVITVGDEGVSGVGANMPNYINGIPVVKMG